MMLNMQPQLKNIVYTMRYKILQLTVSFSLIIIVVKSSSLIRELILALAFFYIMKMVILHARTYVHR